jgi:Mce-associated membrane protein
MESLMSTDTEEAAVAGSASASTARRRRNPLVVAGAVLVAIATVAAVVFGVLWFMAAHNDSLAFSRMRDDALRAAEQGSINLTTLDYRHVQQGMNTWKQSTTGDLYSQLTSGTQASSFAEKAQQAKSITKGSVIEGVITDLDEHAGKASALIYMSVNVTASDGKTTNKRLPLEWQLTLTSSGWKLSGLAQNTSSGQ